MTPEPRTLVIGVAGGSASGKTAVVRELVDRLESATTVLPHDAYYRDLSHLPLAERRQVNVDHPDSLETDLMVDHLDRLMRGESVDVPVYDYSNHVRRPETLTVGPAPVVIVEGILVLADTRLRALMDLGVYVHVPEAERLARRLARDVERRGRTPESVREDHRRRVQPMHREFVRPSRSFADVVIEGGGRNVRAVEALVDRLRGMLR